ncbi:hypothetical protein BG51_19805 [Pseudomonas [fluorescens] ATCC 17400]
MKAPANSTGSCPGKLINNRSAIIGGVCLACIGIDKKQVAQEFPILFGNAALSLTLVQTLDHP